MPVYFLLFAVIMKTRGFFKGDFGKHALTPKNVPIEWF